MIFLVNIIAGVRHHCLLVVVLLHFVPEPTHAFAVTTVRRSSAIKSPQSTCPYELNICHRGSTKNVLYNKATDISGPSLVMTKFARSQSRCHRALPSVFGRTTRESDGREHSTSASEHTFVDCNCRYKPHNRRKHDKFGRILNNIESGRGGGGGEFGWLQKFGNGKADILGLVLSTTLLMMAVPPVGFEGAGPLLRMNQKSIFGTRAKCRFRVILVDSSRNLSQAGLCSATVNVAVTEQRLEEGSDAHRAKLYTIETAHAPFFAVKGGDIIKRSVDSKRADPQQLKEEPLLSGTLLKMTRSTENAVQSAINNPKSIASWRNNFGGHDNRLSRNRPERVASSSGFDATEFVSPRETDNGNGLYHQHTNYVNIPLSPSLRVDSTVSVAQHASAIEVQADAKPLNSGDDRGKLLKALEIEHVALFQESLPVPVLPESFNRALRQTLPVLMPPAMTLFLLVSMPVIVLLLKGIGTTLFAIVKYRDADRFPAHAGSLDVGLGGNPAAGGGGYRNEGSLETPELAFSLFTGGQGRVDDRRLVTESSLEGHDQVKAKTSGKVQQDGNTRKRLFFGKKNPSAIRDGAGQDGVGRGEISRRGFGHIGDDAMAAMAMATMTQELECIKISLQNEVQIMKRELLQASNESKRLTEKLRFLEEENKKLGVVASRLGGQDARRIKAELFSLLT